MLCRVGVGRVCAGRVQMSLKPPVPPSSLGKLPAPKAAGGTSGGTLAAAGATDNRHESSSSAAAGKNGKADGADGDDDADRDADQHAVSQDALARALTSGQLDDMLRERLAFLTPQNALGAAIDSMPEATASTHAGRTKPSLTAQLRAATGGGRVDSKYPPKSTTTTTAAGGTPHPSRSRARRDSDSASDGDSDADRGRDRKSRTERLIAGTVIESAQPAGSLKNYVRLKEWKQERNRHECEVLAHALDALLADGVPVECLGVEILCRRLAGVELADSTGKWSVADEMSWTSTRSLLPRDEVRRVLKSASAFERYSKGSGAASSTSTPVKSAFTGAGKASKQNWRSDSGSASGAKPNKSGKSTNKKSSSPDASAGSS